MGKYVANMDIQIDGKMFHESEQITVKIQEKDASFLLEHDMIREQDDTEPVEPEKEMQKAAESEHVELEKKEQEPAKSEKKIRKQGSKSGNSKETK